MTRSRAFSDLMPRLSYCHELIGWNLTTRSRRNLIQIGNYIHVLEYQAKWEMRNCCISSGRKYEGFRPRNRQYLDKPLLTKLLVSSSSTILDQSKSSQHSASHLKNNAFEPKFGLHFLSQARSRNLPLLRAPDVMPKRLRLSSWLFGPSCFISSRTRLHNSFLGRHTNCSFVLSFNATTSTSRSL